jgi:hypothetical protein
MSLHDEITRRCKSYPLYSQEDSKDPVVFAKLFMPFGSGTWYVTEYNAIAKIGFGYVTGLAHDEWGYFSVEEMSQLFVAGVPAIEVDQHFDPVPIGRLGVLR